MMCMFFFPKLTKGFGWRSIMKHLEFRCSPKLYWTMEKMVLLPLRRAKAQCKIKACLQIYASSSCFFSYVFLTSCNFSLNSMERKVRIWGHPTVSDLNQVKRCLPDSALEECSEAERDSDRCLFFFEWLSSSSESDP